MILVDIYIPVLERNCDFELDEEAIIDEVLDEILRLLARKESVALKGEKQMQLFALRQENLLDKGGTLKGQGVEAGDRLILL